MNFVGPQVSARNRVSRQDGRTLSLCDVCHRTPRPPLVYVRVLPSPPSDTQRVAIFNPPTIPNLTPRSKPATRRQTEALTDASKGNS